MSYHTIFYFLWYGNFFYHTIFSKILYGNGLPYTICLQYCKKFPHPRALLIWMDDGQRDDSSLVLEINFTYSLCPHHRSFFNFKNGNQNFHFIWYYTAVYTVSNKQLHESHFYCISCQNRSFSPLS